MTRHNREQIFFLFFLLIVFAYAAWDSMSFPTKAQTYPRTVALAAIVVTLIELVLYTLSTRKQKPVDAADDVGVFTPQFMKILPYLIWLVVFFIVIYLIGIVLASGLFVFAFLLREGKMRWYFALGSGLIIIAFLLTMETWELMLQSVCATRH